jgi:hypothetical protein
VGLSATSAKTTQNSPQIHKGGLTDGFNSSWVFNTWFCGSRLKYIYIYIYISDADIHHAVW